MDYYTDDFEDKDIYCPDCRTDFIFTAKDQAFYEEKGFTPPKRCKPCRDIRKAQREASGGGQQRRY